MDENICIELNRVDIDNLKIFLGRVDLKGTEVAAFANIIQAISNADVKNQKVGDIDG